VNLTTGDPIVYWTNEEISFDYKNQWGYPAGYTQYSSAKVPDPNNSNVPSWKVPQAAPSFGPTGTCDPTTASSGHVGVVLVGLGDGSVKSVTPTISMKTWNAVISPKGREVVGDDF
jgi:hypothetical protein